MLRVTRTIPKRFKSTPKISDLNKPNEENLTPEEIQKRKQEAAKLAMQSIKDMTSMLSSHDDKEVEKINSKPIYQNPKLFDSLNLLHQGQIIEELQEKYNKNWNKMTSKDKKLGYYISYGNWGPREKFDNWNTSEVPHDLPFENNVNKSINLPNDKISRLPERDLRLTDIRKDQFNIKRIDGVTKFFIYLSLAIALGAIYRDKYIGEDGKPVEVIIRDIYEEQRLEEERLEQERLEKERARKWYYLWLK
ncbi:hypothetical protein CLIB1444_10S04566 [[Candida] jaroonii]|uniref:Uncharacterized protein n=1 Tax=[Candida] jaroonii TaxID=467808 RepID=A0ACA9YCB1_9ASCO|nr:hypothetical protein CLIB1444_10S04566 [[Candida] jaroonii]